MEAAGKALISLLMKFEGEKATSKLIAKIIFGSYLDKIENPKTASDWLTRDEEQVAKYRADKYCRFYFTLSGYKDLINILSLANSNECHENTKKDIP